MKNLLTTIAAATSLTAAAHTTELPQDFQDPAMQKEIAANLEATHNQENTYIL
ncbi:MAG: hypothetical protein H6766_07900 [Candidatus Peribacteria bacterium]|nr:MAG: hypothetical protein H6766_07900 [Candidatus Peribacteria bacterium]